MRDVRDRVGIAFLVVVALTDIWYESDNGEPIALASGNVLREPDEPADGVHAFEVHVGQPLIDDRDLPARSPIAACERVPADQRYANHVEVARPHAEHCDLGKTIVGCGCAAVDLQLAYGTAA